MTYNKLFKKQYDEYISDLDSEDEPICTYNQYVDKMYGVYVSFCRNLGVEHKLKSEFINSEVI